MLKPVKDHDWRTVTEFGRSGIGRRDIQVQACNRCQIVVKRQGTTDTYYHRGEVCDSQVCCEEVPFNLQDIRRLEEGVKCKDKGRLARLIWLLMHWNVRITHQETVLLGLAELVPEKRELFLEALAIQEESLIGALTTALNFDD